MKMMPKPQTMEFMKPFTFGCGFKWELEDVEDM